MTDSPKTDPAKEQKPRSLGSFFIFLLLLVVVLSYASQQSMQRPDEFSQDEYKSNLYLGRIVEQQLKGNQGGSNLIEGTWRRSPGAEAQPFRVEFADAEQHESLWQEIKAEGPKRSVQAQNFVAALAAGHYDPVRARILRRNAVASAPVEVKAQPLVESDEFLQVEVIASSIKRWAADTGAEPTDDPPYWLPATSSHLWLTVDLDPMPGSDTPELAEVVGALGATPLETLTFEVGEGSGTRFASDTSMLGTILMIYGPWLLLAFLVFFFMRQVRAQGGGGGMMSFGKSRAQLYTKENRTGVTFQDVAGAAEAKAEVREIVEFLRNPTRFTKIGGRIPRGILLVGPPGCGKTLLAKAIAGEAEVPFFAISGSDFVEMFVGVGASRVRDLFKQARENSPCIIFLDEIDAVGRRRGGGMGGGHDEREQTLNAILVEMDGFGTDDGIILLAATNRPDVLDPALLRPGRFDREVTIDLPDQKDRQRILEVHLAKVRCADGIDVELLARSSPGYSGADLAAIVNEAAIMAVLDNRERIEQRDLEEARDKVRYGRQKIDRTMEEVDRKVTAYHEAGHAIVAAVHPDADDPTKVTIIPRGRSLGATMMLPEREVHHQQRRRLLAMLATFFGGRAAEARFCGDISAGAHDDIRRATQLARSMVTELGMSDKLGPIHLADRQGSEFLGTELMRDRSHSEDVAKLVDEEIRRMIDQAYEKAESILAENAAAVEELTRALLLYETVDGSGVLRILEGARAESLAPPESDEATLEPGLRVTPPPLGQSRTNEGDGLDPSPGLSPA